MIVLLVYFVWLAARWRKNWPRWVLAAALVLSVISLGQILSEKGLELDSAIEIVSCVLTAMGLYFSFSGDARAGSTREHLGGAVEWAKARSCAPCPPHSRRGSNWWARSALPTLRSPEMR